jgi:hypothetical protein
MMDPDASHVPRNVPACLPGINEVLPFIPRSIAHVAIILNELIQGPFDDGINKSPKHTSTGEDEKARGNGVREGRQAQYNIVTIALVVVLFYGIVMSRRNVEGKTGTTARLR